MTTAQPHAERKHRLFSASIAARWRRCHGSVAAIVAEGIQDKRTKYADEGTGAAERVEAHLMSAKGGRPLDIADQYLQQYVSVIQDAYDQCVLPEMHIEREFDGSMFHDEFGGTCDCIVYCPVINRLWVIDLKWGVGVAVDAYENDQLLSYAVLFQSSKGACHTTMVIVQPRIQHAPTHTTWEQTACQMEEHALLIAEDLMKADDNLRRGHSFDLTPGDKQCRFCPKRHNCEARARQAVDNASLILGDLHVPQPPAPIGLPDETLAKMMRVESVLKQWYKSARIEVARRVSAGNTSLGMKLVQERSRRVWREGMDDDIAAAIMHAGGNPRRLITLTEAGEYLNEDELDQFTVKQPGGVALAFNSDRRPAITSVNLDDLPDDTDD